MTQKLRLIEGGKRRSIFADLEALRIEPDDNPEEVETKEAPPREPFARVPKLWFDRLKTLNASGDLWQLTWVLLYRANLKRRFPVTGTILWEAGMTCRHKRRFFGRLENAGLIRVEWRTPPRVPWVTVLHLPGRRGRSK